MDIVIVSLIVVLAAAAGIWTFYRIVKTGDGCSCCKKCTSKEINDN